MEIKELYQNQALCRYSKDELCRHPQALDPDRPTGVTRELYLVDGGAPRCAALYFALHPTLATKHSIKRMPAEELSKRVATVQAQVCDGYCPIKEIAIKTPDVKLDQPKISRSGILGLVISDKILIPSIPEGTVIDGFEHVKDLNLLTVKAIQDLETTLGVDSRSYPNISDEIRTFLAKKGFFGSLKEITATVLLNALNYKDLSCISEGDNIIRLLFEMGLFSTAKPGRLATYVASLQVSLTRAKNPKIATVFKHLVKKEGLAELDYLLDDSQISFVNERSQQLRNAVSAGLPSLGKRR